VPIVETIEEMQGTATNQDCEVCILLNKRLLYSFSVYGWSLIASCGIALVTACVYRRTIPFMGLIGFVFVLQHAMSP